MKSQLSLISSSFLPGYSLGLQIDLAEAWKKNDERILITSDDFQYYVIASSLFSSKIEGNSLDLNSFMNQRKNRSFIKRKDVEEIEDLVKGYHFARENPISIGNFLKAHGILSKKLVEAKNRGKFRKHKVGVYDTSTGRPVYLAVEPEFVSIETGKLFDDISVLLSEEINLDEVFYYASMIHLWAAKIHPFADGNGRAARLLEKWFLVSKLGDQAWSINSEKYYWDQRPDYYNHIALGFNYYALHWDRCFPFLFMLPAALIASHAT